MREDWEKYGGLPHVLRTGGLEETTMIDARRDAAHEIAELRDILIFVSTDPCFKFLGTVTQDRVKRVPLED